MSCYPATSSAVGQEFSIGQSEVPKEFQDCKAKFDLCFDYIFWTLVAPVANAQQKACTSITPICTAGGIEFPSIVCC